MKYTTAVNPVGRYLFLTTKGYSRNAVTDQNLNLKSHVSCEITNENTTIKNDKKPENKYIYYKTCAVPSKVQVKAVALPC